jgi:hypothetical protein
MTSVDAVTTSASTRRSAIAPRCGRRGGC